SRRPIEAWRPGKRKAQEVQRKHLRGYFEAACLSYQRMCSVIADRPGGQELALQARDDIASADAHNPTLLFQKLDDLVSPIELKRPEPKQPLPHSAGIR